MLRRAATRCKSVLGVTTTGATPHHRPGVHSFRLGPNSRMDSRRRAKSAAVRPRSRRPSIPSAGHENDVGIAVHSWVRGGEAVARIGGNQGREIRDQDAAVDGGTLGWIA